MIRLVSFLKGSQVFSLRCGISCPRLVLSRFGATGKGILIPRCHELTYLWLALLCQFLVTPAFSELVENEKKANVEQIKAYLTEHPAISIAVVQFKNGGSETAMWSEKAGSIALSEYVIFQGARQDGDFYVRQVREDFEESEPFGTNTVFAIGRSDRTGWHAGHAGSLTDSIFIVKTTLNSNETSDFFRPESRTNNVVQIASNVGSQFNRFLNFGLIDIRIGTFRFDGNKFKVQLNRGREAEGELLAENGHVNGIKYQIAGDDVYLISELIYESGSIPSFFPTKAIQKVYNNEGVCLRTNLVFQFLRITLATNKLDTEYFLPDRFDPSTKDGSVWVAQLGLTNGIAYQRVNGGARKLSNVPEQLPTNALFKPFFYFGLIFSGFVLLLLVRREKNNRKKT